MLRRGPKKGILKDKPIYPKVVKKIVLLRRQGLTFSAISEALKPRTVMTRVGVWQLYKRWENWVE